MPCARAGSRWTPTDRAPIDLFRGLSSAFLDILFPRRCVQCGASGAWICGGCAAGVHLMQPPLCECCGREVGAGNRCQQCAKERLKIDGIRAAARYEGAIRQAVHRLKYSGQRAVAAELGGYLSTVALTLPPADAIVPLPLHPRRLRQRGYNQAELLARDLGHRLNLPVFAAAERVRETRDQIGLKRTERQQNVRGAFGCPKPAAVVGKRLLLVDDVCTTGSTLVACAAPLLRAGAREVWGLVVARQDLERT